MSGIGGGKKDGFEWMIMMMMRMMMRMMTWCIRRRGAANSRADGRGHPSGVVDSSVRIIVSDAVAT
jgi:hypothetical protein